VLFIYFTFILIFHFKQILIKFFSTKMSSSPKLLVLVVLSVLSLLAICVHSLPEDIPSEAVSDGSIESMMTEAEKRGLSVVFNTKGRTLPLIFNPLAQLVTAIKPLTVLKLGALYSGVIYFIAFMFPTAFGVKARSLGSPSFDFDYEYIQKSLSSLTERTSSFLQVPEPDCRYRAVCEAATYVATKVPLINEWAKKVSGAFFLNLANPYSKAWINGMMQIDCTATYDKCVESPFRTIVNRFVAKK